MSDITANPLIKAFIGIGNKLAVLLCVLGLECGRNESFIN